jgi:hypothetical protein
MSTSTPPSLPPKSPSLAPSTRTNRSTTTFSSYTTENPISPARPTRAQRGTRTQASSVHLSFSGPLGALAGPQMNPSHSYDPEDDDDLASEGELANLPWAEPPPRDPSPYPSLLRQPSLSFLASDPAQQQNGPNGDTVSRRSSRSSIGSRRSQSHLSPAHLPNSNLSPALDTHRFSGLTVHSFQSGMADAEVGSEVHSVEQLGPTPPRIRDDSPRSAMAVRAESSLSHRSNSIKSALKSKARSLKSTASSRKRHSNSTIHRRSFQKRYGKWEVEMSPLLEEDARRREEQLELSALLGRATVLERMLKAGRRVCFLCSLISAPLMARSHAHQRPSPRSDALHPSLPNHQPILHP